MKKVMYVWGVLAIFLMQVPAASANKKLVVIDGSITEIVYALGEQEHIVAVDTTSIYPEDATKLPNVGYMRALSAEGILSVKPTMVIATESAGPPQVLEHLKKTGIDIQLVDNSYSVEGIYQKIDTVSHLLNQKAKGVLLKQTVAKSLSPILENIKNKSHIKPKILVFLGMQGNQLMAAGEGTQAEAVINILGAINVAGSFKGYKPMNTEAVIASGADAIIVLSHAPSPSSDDGLSAFSYTKAAKNNKLIVAQSAQLLGFGPRFPNALKKVVDALYAE